MPLYFVVSLQLRFPFFLPHFVGHRSILFTFANYQALQNLRTFVRPQRPLQPRHTIYVMPFSSATLTPSYVLSVLESVLNVSQITLLIHRSRCAFYHYVTHTFNLLLYSGGNHNVGRTPHCCGSCKLPVKIILRQFAYARVWPF